MSQTREREREEKSTIGQTMSTLIFNDTRGRASQEPLIVVSAADAAAAEAHQLPNEFMSGVSSALQRSLVLSSSCTRNNRH